MPHSNPDEARPPLAYPDSPEMTGRIDLCSHSISSRGERSPTAELNSDTDATIAFSVEPEPMLMDRLLTKDGDYLPGNEIARGGMGRIFAADDQFLDRAVAIKVSTVKGEKEDAQFLREARVLAHLAHPNIVPVHHLGKDSQGRPFYSMKLVKGRTLRAILKDLSAQDAETVAAFTRQRLLDVFRKVCDAVSFAHAKGFLHRDLKPENIMIGEYGEVLVMDWGLAKVLARRSSPGALLFAEGDATETEPETLGYVEGTPQYMSPEQASGMFRGLDERSDIYSLGGILFAILTRQPPVTGKSVEEVVEKVREGHIETLTVAAGSVGGGVSTPMAERIPEALRAITLKALSKDRERRYASVNALAVDIDAYLGGFATVAEDANLLRHSILFVKRHRIASALALVLLISAIGFTLRLGASEKRARASAEIAEASAKRAELEKNAARQLAARTQIALAEAAEGDSNAEQMRVALGAVPEDLRDASWRYLNTRRDTSDVTIKPPSGTTWVGIEDDPNNAECMFALQDDGAFCSVNVSTGQTTSLWSVNSEPAYREESSLCVSPDGTTAVIALQRRKENGSFVCDFEFRRTADGSPVGQIRDSEAVGVLKMWLSEKMLLVSSFDHQSSRMTAFDVQPCQVLWQKVAHQTLGKGHFYAGFGPDKQTVLLLTDAGEMQKLDALSGRVLAVAGKKITPWRSNASEPLATSHDWKYLYAATVDKPNKIRSYDPWTGELHFETTRLSGRNVALGLHPQKKIGFCLSNRSGQGYALEVFNKSSGESLEILPFLAKSASTTGNRLNRPKIRVKGERVAVLLFDKIVVWNLQNETPTRTTRSSSPDFARSSSRIIGDKETFAFTSVGATACLNLQDTGKDRYWEVRQEIELARTGKGTLVNFLSANGDGSKILTGRFGLYSAHSFTEKGLSLLWNKKISPLERGVGFIMHPSEDLFWNGDFVVEFSSGKILTEVNRTGLTDLSRIYEDPLKVDWIGADRVVEIVILESSGEREAGDPQLRALRLWNTKTGEPVVTTEAIHAVAVSTSPDGAWIAEAGDNKRLRLRHSETLSVERDVRVHDKALTSVAWHPTLPLIVTTAEDGKVRIWNLSDFKLVREYRLATGDFLGEARVSANGKNLHIRLGGKLAILAPECFQQ